VLPRSVCEWAGFPRFQHRAGTKIADFGCGPGLYAERLARRHAAVHGIDFSQRSIEYARKTAEPGRTRRSLHQTELPDLETDSRFDLILMIMCDYCALGPPEEKNAFHVSPASGTLGFGFSRRVFSSSFQQASGKSAL
jgi:SAM-dependent methyltransferase